MALINNFLPVTIFGKGFKVFKLLLDDFEFNLKISVNTI